MSILHTSNATFRFRTTKSLSTLDIIISGQYGDSNMTFTDVNDAVIVEDTLVDLGPLRFIQVSDTAVTALTIQKAGSITPVAMFGIAKNQVNNPNCLDFASCSLCTQQPACGWCQGALTCLPTTESGLCNEDWLGAECEGPAAVPFWVWIIIAFLILFFLLLLLLAGMLYREVRNRDKYLKKVTQDMVSKLQEVATEAGIDEDFSGVMPVLERKETFWNPFSSFAGSQGGRSPRASQAGRSNKAEMRVSLTGRTRVVSDVEIPMHSI